MMLKLDFEEFQKKLIQNSSIFPTLHYCVLEDTFTLIFMSGESWQYYTIVTFEDIKDFAGNEGIQFDEAIEQFRINYLSNAVEVYLQHKDELYLKEVEQQVEDYENENQSSEIIQPPIKRSIDVSSEDDLVKDAIGYSDFLLKLFDRFEQKTLSAVDKIQLSKEYTTKTFGDFLSELFNTVNTVAFSKHIKKYLRMDLLAGLEAAEDELNADIGYTESFQQKLAQLQQQQLSGYTINGKKWFGIKGVTKELQADIISIVQGGINDKLSTKEIKEAISNKFDTFSDWRSNMIARTETTRVINEGKILGYKESGIEGNKVWSTAPYDPNRSSEICQRLKDQSVPLDKDFIDPKTNKAFAAPPAHPNCRSTIVFRPN